MKSPLPYLQPASTGRTFGQSGDLVILGALALAAVAAAAIGSSYDNLGLGLGLGALLLVLGAGSYFAAPGSRFSRIALALCLSAMVALHIQLGRGTLEFHFGVFVTIALMLVYRDWRPIVASAVFFAVHHIVFDRMQAGGYGVYCTTEPNFLKIVMHAAYVVVQTGLEVAMAVRLAALATAGDELQNLVQAIDSDEAVSLDLSQAEVCSPQALGLKKVMARMQHAMAEVRGSASQIELASTEIATGNLDLSNRTEQTASNLQQAASSIEELSGTVRQTADSARQASQLATSASEVAVRGGQVVAQVVATMDEINASSKRIADIIGTIDGIAFQTNILALNAAVEAARAGEQGRGFAVVASEVRSLAQRSAEAAREIKTLIGASVDRVEAGSKLVADAGQTMTEIVSSVQNVTQIIGEISVASQEQSSGIGLVNGSVNQLEQMTQQNAALVEQSTAAAESLREQAQRLSTVLKGFDLGHQSAAVAPAPIIRKTTSPNLAKDRLKPAHHAGVSAPKRAASGATSGSAGPRSPAAKAAAPAPALVAEANSGSAAGDDWTSF